MKLPTWKDIKIIIDDEVPEGHIYLVPKKILVDAKTGEIINTNEFGVIKPKEELQS